MYLCNGTLEPYGFNNYSDEHIPILDFVGNMSLQWEEDANVRKADSRGAKLMRDSAETGIE